MTTPDLKGKDVKVLDVNDEEIKLVTLEDEPSVIIIQCAGEWGHQSWLTFKEVGGK